MNNAIKEIADRYGKQSQIVKAIEEMAELTHELARDLIWNDRREQIVEELVDVKIMLEQLIYLYDITDAEIKGCENYKIQRTLNN